MKHNDNIGLDNILAALMANSYFIRLQIEMEINKSTKPDDPKVKAEIMNKVKKIYKEFMGYSEYIHKH